MNQKYTIRLETKDDYFTVENLTRDSFWNVYAPGCTEQYVLNQFRSNPDYKRKGYGKILLDYSMDKAKALHGSKGYYKDPEGYFVALKNPEAFEKYDSKFPYKEKLKLPGQLV